MKEKAIAMVKKMARAYFEERNFSQVLAAVNKDISWIGTGAHEICHNYKDALKLLQMEQQEWSGRFRITQEWYEAVPLNEEYYIVYGEVKMKEDDAKGLNVFLLEVGARFSLFCKKNKDNIEIIHAHFSVPNEAQKDGEFMNRTIVNDYEKLLLEKLEERTTLLKEKMRELETVMTNMQGGVQICKNDEAFTSLYINEGFCKLVGYEMDEFISAFGRSFFHLMGRVAFEKVHGEMNVQLKERKSFSVEYSLVKKDGTVIWVLEKGVAVEEGGEQLVYSFVTDITETHKTRALLITKNEQLRLNEKRYEIAMQNSDILIFDYLVADRRVLYSAGGVQRLGYSRSDVVTVESLLADKIVLESSWKKIEVMQKNIENGKPYVEDIIGMLDAHGQECLEHISLTNILSEDGRPLRAIGVMRDVTEMNKLKLENQYKEAMVADKQLIYEGNITQNKVLHLSHKWSKIYAVPAESDFYEVIDFFCTTSVHPNHKDKFKEFYDKKNIEHSLQEGDTQLVLEYMRKDDCGVYKWVQQTMNIIQDNLTGDVKICCYTKDITQQREKILKAEKKLDEQRYYEIMISKSVIVYDINFTKDFATRDDTNNSQLTVAQGGSSYTQIIDFLAERAVHPEDIKEFYRILSIENVLASYRAGKEELCAEYRRQKNDGSYLWVACTIHLFEDVETADIRGFGYVEDIDEGKVKQLELIYKAEHDVLTGLYNKSMTEQIIDKYLSSEEGKTGQHAFFIFDIDFFKGINDNFGHVFGDAVLSQVGNKIRELFRGDDILGRIGGDEFVAVMKNISGMRTVIAKGKEINEMVQEKYTQRGRKYSVSTSIGVALYPMHGASYKTLYKHSDNALYAAKENGRNRCEIYHHGMAFHAYEDKKFDVSSLVEVRSFEKNISEYVFKILYDSSEKVDCINAVLELIGKWYNVSRVYIFENSPNQQYTCNTFEWCSEGITPQIKPLSKVPLSSLGNYSTNFDHLGIFYMRSVSEVSQDIRKILEPQGIKSMLQFAIVRNEQFEGFIGFDQCQFEREATKEEITDLRHVTNILGVFLGEMRSIAAIQSAKNAVLSIVNALDSYAYVIDRETHAVLFINNKTRDIAPFAQIGQKCYKCFWDKDEPCACCPMEGLSAFGDEKCSLDLYNGKFNVWTKATASWIDWVDNKKACLIDSVDITKYK